MEKGGIIWNRVYKEFLHSTFSSPSLGASTFNPQCITKLWEDMYAGTPVSPTSEKPEHV